MFGPARRVQAYGTALQPERVLLDGTRFGVESPDFVVAVLELADGVVCRLTGSFYVGPSKQRGIELHGDTGSLYTPTWAEANSRVELQRRGGTYAEVTPVRAPFDGIDWGRPLVDLAEAIEQGRPHRASAEHAVHVVEITEAVATSIERGGPVEVASGFEPPEPMDWAR